MGFLHGFIEPGQELQTLGNYPAQNRPAVAHFPRARYQAALLQAIEQAVISGSRVIMRLAISPQGRAAGAPRRIRSTLYCVAEMFSVLSTWTSPRDNISVVRSRSKKAASSGHEGRRGLANLATALAWYIHSNRCNEYCQDGFVRRICRDPGFWGQHICRIVREFPARP
jgi:hypothetical protein